MNKHFFFLLLFAASKLAAQNFDALPTYSGNNLGLSLQTNGAEFRIWSPTAEAARIVFYKDDVSTQPEATVAMSKAEGGTWIARQQGDWKGKRYVFQVKINGNWSREVVDPYAKAVGTNGKRAVVVDLAESNPVGWDKDQSPSFSATNAPTSAIVYELHVRDATIHPSSGAKYAGKFLGLSEETTRTKDGKSTGLAHLRDLGVTHIHLLPSFDYNSVDESRLNEPQYNWGYDPLNYNAPEGSYSLNPADALGRIREMKTMIQAMHRNGLRVVMDVVYNHTALSKDSYFNALVPNYYYRQRTDGNWSDASGCGNEIASERTMVRKMMIESLVYWMKEYHIDGFRFDLMGAHDVQTMQEISDQLHAIKKDVLLYGEGWTAGGSPLPDADRALKSNVSKLTGIAVFSDDVRDGIKGSVFEEKDFGFISGKAANTESIKFGVVAACAHPQVDMSKVNYSKKPYATEPSQVITYCECHDNLCLYDKLKVSAEKYSEEQRIAMQKLALGIVLTSQGIPFLHAGTEFLRSKQGVENSYKSPDSVNAIDWTLKSKNEAVFKYVQGLIQLRKAHPAFTMNKAEDIAKAIRFDALQQEGTLSYSIDGTVSGDKWKTIRVVMNGTDQPQTFALPAGQWNVGIMSDNSNMLKEQTLTLPGFSMAVIYQ